MPRISKTSTKFDLDGSTFFASFQHRRADKKGQIVVERKDANGRKIITPILHQTYCRLYEKTKIGDQVKHHMVADGSAWCSYKERRYDWRKGIELSFRRAIEQITQDGLKIGQFMRTFLKEVEIRG